MKYSSRSLTSAIVVVSDMVEAQSGFSCPVDTVGFATIAQPEVIGGYLERLPLAAVRAGLCDHAEIWHFHRANSAVASTDGNLTRRVFPISDDRAPFHSASMLEFIERHGAPAILCVWGLGISEDLLDACQDSVIIYNSIDVPALRVPPQVSQHFDLVLTGADWQSEDVAARHPHMTTAVLPIGPEFASGDTFFPIPGEKPYDVVYVAAAQPYKRHDILFDALARAQRPLKALCVIGYGEDGQRLREQANSRHLDVEFVGPPGVPHSEVNRLINLAKVGVVCGENDGAPAILTEYMLAGLPVVANSALRCGLQYITPQTGLVARGEHFEHAIIAALDNHQFSPRQSVLNHWIWPHSISRLASLIEGVRAPRKMAQRVFKEGISA